MKSTFANCDREISGKRSLGRRYCRARIRVSLVKLDMDTAVTAVELLLPLLQHLLVVMEHAVAVESHLRAHLVLLVNQETMGPQDSPASLERMDKMLHRRLHLQKLNGASNALKPPQEHLADLDQRDHPDKLANQALTLMAVKEGPEDHLDLLEEQDNPETPVKQANQEHPEYFEMFQDLLEDQVQLVLQDNPGTQVAQDSQENKDDRELKVLQVTRVLQEVQENQELTENKDHKVTKAILEHATIVRLPEQHPVIKNEKPRDRPFICAVNYNTAFSLIIVRVILTAQMFKH